MITLFNFETNVSKQILQKGKEYYDNSDVGEVEKAGPLNWSAEVEGRDVYTVSVTLKKNNEIKDYSCNCLYDGNICKHVVSLLYAVQDEIKIPEGKSKTTKINAFNQLLQSLTKAALDDFIRMQSARNKQFKQEFELYFADRNSNIDIEKTYKKHAQLIVKKYTRGGYIDYRESSSFSKEIGKLLDTGKDNALKHNFRSAFAIATAVCTELLETITFCDDSSGKIADKIEEAIDLLETIAHSPEAAIDIKEELFTFLEKEVDNKNHFNFGNFGYHMFSMFQDLSIQLNKSDKLLRFIDRKLAEPRRAYDEFTREFFKKCKIELLEQTGRVEEVRLLVQENLDIVEVRLDEVNKAIKQKDFAAAKKLIAGGIRVAESKRHPGTVSRWQEELLRIAVLEKDITTIRHFTRLFAFDNWFSEDYYKQWKKTFSTAAWKEEIEKHIETTIQAITKKWSSTTYRPAHAPILATLAPVYIQENYLDRLLLLVQQDAELNTVLRYHAHLFKKFPGELLALYIPALEQYGLNARDRNDYAYLVRTMKQIIKDLPDGKDDVLNVAGRLKAKFSSKPRRPAMMEELDRLILK
jgi:hypothetical protein